MRLFGRKSDKNAKLSREEVDQLKQQLNEKMGEYRALYNQLVEAGGAELPEEILDQVSGGIAAVIPTSLPPSGTSGGSGGGDR